MRNECLKKVWERRSEKLSNKEKEQRIKEMHERSTGGHVGM